MRRLRELFQQWLRSDAPALSPAERWRSTIAALLGMSLIQGMLHVLPLPPEQRLLLAPLGASSVILFALPHSPLGQPWATAGGLLVSGAIGWACGHWIAPAWLAVSCALALAIWAMARLRCIHPPGGAMAVGFATLAAPTPAGLATIGWNVAAIILAALAVNALFRERRWPQWAPPAPQATPRPLRSGIEHRDLQQALEEIDAYLDISEEDLVRVYELATVHAFARHERRTCAEIMRREVVSVEFATELNEAWRLLRQHHLKALPVIDRSRRVLGLITAEAFLDHVQPDARQPIGENVRRLLRATPSVYSDKPEVAGQIMREKIVVARTDDSIASVVSLLAQREHPPAVPVVDAEGRLAGILGQTDLLAALYHRQALGNGAA